MPKEYQRKRRLPFIPGAPVFLASQREGLLINSNLAIAYYAEKSSHREMLREFLGREPSEDDIRHHDNIEAINAKLRKKVTENRVTVLNAIGTKWFDTPDGEKEFFTDLEFAAQMYMDEAHLREGVETPPSSVSAALKQSISELDSLIGRIGRMPALERCLVADSVDPLHALSSMRAAAATTLEDMQSTISNRGNRPDIAKHNFCEALQFVMLKHLGGTLSAAQTTRSEHGIAAPTEEKSPLARFLEAVFFAVGINESGSRLAEFFVKSSRANSP